MENYKIERKQEKSSFFIKKIVMGDLESAQMLLESAEAARDSRQNDRAIDYCNQVEFFAKERKNRLAI